MNNADLIEPTIRDAAVHWYVIAQSGMMDAAQHADLKQWLAADSRHAVAWQRLAAVGGQVRGRINAELAGATFQRVGVRRRAVLKSIAGIGLLGAAGWQAQQLPWSQRALADLRTATGERRSIVLADGTRLILNTASAVDVRFDATRRLLVLKAGEIDIATARDARPLIVETTSARLQPIGTRFVVRSDTPDGATWLSVTEGRVAARPTGAQKDAERVINAGQRARITRSAVTEPQALDASDTAWIDGVITASRMRLDDFVAELSRYRSGVLRCDPAVAALRLSGAFPVGDTDDVLRAVAQTLPVSIRYHTRWWVSVGPR